MKQLKEGKLESLDPTKAGPEVYFRESSPI